MMNETVHNPIPTEARTRPGRAFSLIEILVTVALLSVIILGLVAMFNQTRRAFTSSLAQVDVLEAGRAAADMIARDVSQMAPCYYSNNVNASFSVPNFYSATSANYNNPLLTQLANPADRWTNLIQELFFLTPGSQNSQQWSAIGYRLQMTDENNSVGTLYRFYAPGLTTTNANITNNLKNQLNFFTQPNLTENYNRIIDGVTHFRILAYQPDGTPFPLIKNGNLRDVRQGNFYPNWEFYYRFFSNTVPAYVEVELGILETQALERYRAFGPGTQAANNYLTSHPGVVHLFRQRIPIRNVDPSAFQ